MSQYIVITLILKKGRSKVHHCHDYEK